MRTKEEIKNSTEYLNLLIAGGENTIVRAATTKLDSNIECWKYTSIPISVKEISPEGNIICTDGTILPLDYTDMNWIRYSAAKTTNPANPLSKWIGRKIVRKYPTYHKKCTAYMNKESAPTLVSANIYHLGIIDAYGEFRLLNRDFCLAHEWKLA